MRDSEPLKTFVRTIVVAVALGAAATGCKDGRALADPPDD
jgi:hypothetical protein